MNSKAGFGCKNYLIFNRNGAKIPRSLGSKGQWFRSLNQQLVKIVSPQWLIPGTALFSLFNDLYRKHAQQVGGQWLFEQSVPTWKDCHSKDLDSLEKWAGTEL